MLKNITKKSLILSSLLIAFLAGSLSAQAAPVIGVAVGGNELMATTTDSVHWTTQKSPYSLYDILWNGQQWMAVGSEIGKRVGVILTSSDGINWKVRRNNTVTAFDAVGWDGMKWLILADRVDEKTWVHSTSLWSTNNDAEEPKEIDAKLPYMIFPKIKNDGTQWLITSQGTSTHYNSYILRSDDGIHWFPLPDLMRTITGVSGITFRDGTHQWIMAGDGGIVTSQDTINWVYQSADKRNGAIQWNGEQWAIANWTRPTTSNNRDVSSWHEATAADEECAAIGIDWDPNNKKWIAVGGSYQSEQYACIYTADKTGNVWTTTKIVSEGAFQNVAFRKINP
jgi:hypothetical protein